MQINYRAIVSEMLTAQAAAIGTFAAFAASGALLAEQEYKAMLAKLAVETRARDACRDGGPAITGVLPPLSANFCRALAGLPRVSIISFLSRYDDLRGRRDVVRD